MCLVYHTLVFLAIAQNAPLPCNRCQHMIADAMILSAKSQAKVAGICFKREYHTAVWRRIGAQAHTRYR